MLLRICLGLWIFFSGEVLGGGGKFYVYIFSPKTCFFTEYIEYIEYIYQVVDLITYAYVDFLLSVQYFSCLLSRLAENHSYVVSIT